MFVDFQHGEPPTEPWQPRPPKPRLTPRQEAAMGWIVAVNLVLLLVAPIAGFTLFDAMIALFAP